MAQSSSNGLIPAPTQSKSADATIVVSRVDHVTRDQAQRLKESMARLTDGSPIGVVVNAATVDGAEYGYGAA